MGYYLSENFTYREFEKSETAERLEIDNTIKHDSVRNNIKELVYHVLQPLREKLNKPIVITSGYRCPELNKAVGGVSTSQHVNGQAVDFIVIGMNVVNVAKTIIEMELPYDQLGIYNNFLHVSVSPRQRRQIYYDKSYKGSKL